ncbi:hypothetical protein AAG906_020356 [Vitis piasezkii]
MSVANIGKLQENIAALCKMVRNSPIETPSFPIRRQNSGCKTFGWNGGGNRIPDVIHPGGKWRRMEWRRQSDGIPTRLSIALPWIPNNSPQSQIALVIKKLSKHQNLTQFD